MFTQQHFVAIAKTLKGRRHQGEGVTRVAVNETIDRVTIDFADLFKAHNERFDRARFYKAADYAVGSR